MASIRYLKSGTVGLTGSVVASLWASSKGENFANILVMGRAIPIWVVAGGVMAITSMAADLVHEYVLPGLSKDEKFVDGTSAVISVLAPAATAVGAVAVVNSNVFAEAPMAQVALAGVGCEIVGSYIYTNFVRSMIQY